MSLLHSERLKGVNHALVTFVHEAVKVFEAEFDIAIVSGLRTEAEQEALFAQGRTTMGEPPVDAAHPLGHVVTNAPHASSSAHGRGGALDICPVVKGKWLWEDVEKFTQLGRFAEAHSLTWGGRWVHLRDIDHVEVTAWQSLPYPPKE